MRKNGVMLAAVVGFGLMAGTAQVVAHHAFAAEFDANRPVRLAGKITRMEWINPHAWMHLEVTNEDGTVDNWMIEAGPPGALVRRGWSKNSVLPGIEVMVEGYQAIDGALRANGRDVTFPDGRRLFAGSSGTGAPLDGRDSRPSGGSADLVRSPAWPASTLLVWRSEHVPAVVRRLRGRRRSPSGLPPWLSGDHGRERSAFRRVGGGLVGSSRPATVVTVGSAGATDAVLARLAE